MSDRSDAWHQSTLQSILDGCSWQYFLEYVLKLEAPSGAASLAGSAYHAAVEAHETNRNQVGMEDMLQVAETFLVDRAVEDEDIVAEAHASVRNFFKPTKGGGLSHRDWLAQYEPVDLEKYVRVPLVDGAMPIAGTVDGVYRDGGRLFLVDHKTAGSFSRWGKEGEEHRKQATLYSVALALSPEYPVDGLVPMNYLVVRRSEGRSKSFEAARRVIVEPSLADVQILGDRVREAERVVRDEDYVRNPSWNLCDKKWCAFYAQCVVTGELSGTVQSVRNRVSQI